MAERKLSVRMFGGFTANYGDEVLTFGRQRNSKFGQLFQILMTRPGKGFSKEEIAESLYGKEEVEDLNASLNNTIFRLRRYLKESPLPSGDYLVLDGGIVRFAGEIQVESDVWNFEKTAREFAEEQNRRKKAEISERALEFYQGELLPQLANEQWVMERSRNYRRLYTSMLEYLLDYLKEEGDYRNIERTAAHAARLSPNERWEIWQADSLIALGRYKEAGKVYESIAAHAQEMGGFLSRKQQAQFCEIGDRIHQPEGTQKDIRKYLMETGMSEGAYACTLLGFRDCFRMLKRALVRGGI